MRYEYQLLTEEWKKKSAEIKVRDGKTCQMCKNDCVKLEAHHIQYLGYDVMAWDYPNEYLITLCHDCHEAVHFFISEYGDYVYEISTT